MKSTSSIFATKNISLIDKGKSGKLSLDFYGEQIDFMLCEWFSFISKIKKIDIASLVDSESPDVEIVHLGHCDKFLILSAYEILELMDLFEGVQFIMDLNQVIQQKIKNRCLLTS